MAKKWIEQRRRGFFGWIFLIAFWAWNAFMAYGLFAGIGANVAQYERLAEGAYKQGYATGAALGAMSILMLWGIGTVILGLLAYFTRGRREMIEVDT